MIHIWQQFIDTMFPPSPSLIILRQYKNISYRQFFEPRTVDGTIALSHYESPLIKASITAGKFEHNLNALSALGELLRQYLQQSPSYSDTNTILVPIPLHPKRERERGYNQVEVIVHNALHGTNYRSLPLLCRQTNTSPQSHLKRNERLVHLNDAFAYQPSLIQWDAISHVLLVDDVVTTGSTLAAGRKILTANVPAHVTIHTLAIAH